MQLWKLAWRGGYIPMIETLGPAWNQPINSMVQLDRLWNMAHITCSHAISIPDPRQEKRHNPRWSIRLPKQIWNCLIQNLNTCLVYWYSRYVRLATLSYPPWPSKCLSQEVHWGLATAVSKVSGWGWTRRFDPSSHHFRTTPPEIKIQRLSYPMSIEPANIAE